MIPKGRGVTWNVGHRGAAGLEPENTLRAFRRAFAEGADALETDLRLTRDGHPVILHDGTVDRTTDGSGPVSEMSLPELRDLDAGLGERVPSLEEALEVTDLPVFVEIKAVEAAEPLAQFIETEGIARRVMPISFEAEALRQVRAVSDSIATGLILDDAPDGALADLARKAGAALVSVEVRGLSAGTVEQCRRAGLALTCWTVNETGEMRRAVELGVDGVVTDRPDLMADVLASGR